MRHLLAAIATALVALVAVCPAATASDHARFVAETSSATITEGGVRVAFEEVGLAPGEAAQVEIAVRRTTRITCRSRAMSSLHFTFSSTASALESMSHTADDTGRVSDVRTIGVQPGSVEITGWTCTPKTDATVTLRDVANGAELTLPVAAT
jgi:hypothetical protein